MSQKRLLDKIAKLESQNDQILAELDYLDEISRKLGFFEGLKTLKEAAIELLEHDLKESNLEDEINPDCSNY